ncbi:acyl-CoA dehydrogenase family protein [Nocardiopsis sp. RSe5-2]|uniref:Acyl-CoA dehydrogenase family protein n=1 Tax=Nocardiopsis endophytica TaxID=3018445 RepID=A0ABT4UC11_9ACTN|nr:acyl-CoA dehydrogenase family protein [Nocardiopsis endophytica]MDA2814448.1 acyl-CoA dehydrogenase family protein [Nocardiopsis endophytica]
MAFSLSPHHRGFAERARTAARREFGRDGPAAPEPPPATGPADGPGDGHDLLRRLARCGLLGLLFPGGPAPAIEICLLREAVAGVSTAAETALALQGLGAYPILQSGTPEQAERWIPQVASGAAAAAFALSEPEAGSDAAALRLEARPDPRSGGWTLHGEKTWISNAPHADVITVFARTGPEQGAKGVTAFLVPADRPGLSAEPIEMLGEHALGSLRFDGVPVGRGDLLGEEGRGFRTAMRTLDLFRPSVGAFAVGMAQAALDAARGHAARRQAFGGPLRDQQAVAHTLAEMATRTEAARLLVYWAADALDAQGADGDGPSGADAGAGGPDTAGPGATERAAMAKLYATETAQYVVDAAVQIHGARALRRGHLLEHLYREVRAPRIYEGASEVQRGIIAREMYRRADASRTHRTGVG